MATLQGAAVAAPTIQATKTPPAEGQAARVVSDIIPGRVPVPSSSATPGSVQQPLVQQQLQLQPLRPSSQPQSPQPGGEANRGMAAHHRILALNRAWEEKRTKKREGGLEGWDSDSSATASDSDEGDIIIPPKRKILPPGRQPAQHSRATRAAQAAPSTPATRPPPPGQPLRRPSNVPPHLVVPSSSNKTPVPLPEYTWNPPPGSGRPDQKAGQPPARAHVAHRKLTAAELRAEARRFTDALVRKKLSTVGGGSGTPMRQKSTGEAAARAKASATPPVKSVAGAPPAKVSTATPPPKVPTATPPVKVSTVTPPVNAPGGGPLPSPTGEMRFTTPGELLARIRHAAPPSQTTPASAVPPSAAAPAQLPNVDRGKGHDGSDWAVDASETEETDDNSDLMMLDEAPPGFEGIRPAKPISIEKVTKDKSSVLESSLDGRPYTMFYHSGPDGPREVSRGTIIPTGYNLHEPPLRYICPVRDCRRLLKNMIALGGHFTAAHKGGKFNDNRDGTLSLVDTYKNPVGYSPAIVISQKPLPSNSPPPVEPSIPPWSNLLKRGGNPIQPVQGGKGPKWVIGASGAAATPTLPSSPALKTAVQRPVQGTDDVISYLHSYLAKTHTVPDRPDIRFMEKLPRLRNLPAGWISHHRTSYLPIGLYASALAYLTGDEITGAGACTQNTGSASRLSDVCVALPSSLPADARKELTKLSTCVGCHYYSHLYRQRNACDWAGNELSLGGSVEKSKAASAADVPSKSATPVTSSGREDVVAGEATPPADAVLRPRTLASTREPRKKRPAPALPASVGRSFKAPKVSAVSTAQPDDAGLDEMEPWEFAPGRLTDDTGSENVAFSGAYLTNAQPVTVFQDVGINIIVVKPGSSNRWATETAKLRTCTVAAGKIKVKVAETTFQVGPNGAFVIQPGQTALVENKCYVDATVHCVTVKDYELSS